MGGVTAHRTPTLDVLEGPVNPGRCSTRATGTLLGLPEPPC